MQKLLLLRVGDGFDAGRLEHFDGRVGLRGRIDAAGGRIKLRGGREQARGEAHGVAQTHLRRPWLPETLLETQDAPNSSRTGTGGGVSDRLELRPERIVKVNARLRRCYGVV